MEQKEACLADHTHPVPVRIWTLGHFSVERYQSSEPGKGPWYVPLEIASGINQNIIKYLLCAPNRSARRDKLYDSICPEISKETTVNTYHSRAMAFFDSLQVQLIQKDRQNIALYDQSLVWIDAQACLDYVARAQSSTDIDEQIQLLHACQRLLAKGSFLEGNSETWVYPLKVQLETVRRDSTYQLVALYQNKGCPADYQEAEKILFALLTTQGFDEETVSELMLLYVAQNKHHLAIRTAQYWKEFHARHQEVFPEKLQELMAYIYRKWNPLRIHVVRRQSPGHADLPSGHESQEPYLHRSPALSGDIMSSKDGISGASLDDCSSWFNCRLARIIALVSQRHWRIPIPELQRLVTQELQDFDEVKHMFDANAYALSRRESLFLLASLPLGWLGFVQQSSQSAIEEEILPSCTASIAACWSLLNGRDLELTDNIISQYIPFLIKWSQQSCSFQRSAAYLAAQAHLLLSLSALHRMDFALRIHYCKQAIKYAELAGVSRLPRLLLVKAFTMLGNAYYEKNEYAHMLEAYQQALYVFDNEVEGTKPAVLHSKILMGLAHAYAQVGNKDAIERIQQARDVFTDQPEDLPVFLSADDGAFALTLFEGWVLLDLARRTDHTPYNHNAVEALSQIERYPSSTKVPERIRVEITNRRAQAAIAVNDLAGYLDYTQQAAQSLPHIASKKRRDEIVHNYQAARQQWPKESRVLEIADLLVTL